MIKNSKDADLAVYTFDTVSAAWNFARDCGAKCIATKQSTYYENGKGLTVTVVIPNDPTRNVADELAYGRGFIVDYNFNAAPKPVGGLEYPWYLVEATHGG